MRWRQQVGFDIVPNLSVFCKDAPLKQCEACGSPIPEEDEQCPDCGYYISSYDVGETPDDDANVDEDVDLSDAVDANPKLMLSSQTLAELLQHVLPRDVAVYGWWDHEHREMCATWFSPRGWFATVTRTATDGSWDNDARGVLRGALRRMVGPFSSLTDLALSVRYDEHGKLGGLPPAEAGAILWGLLRLLDDAERHRVKEQVKVGSKHVRGRKQPPAAGTQLP